MIFVFFLLNILSIIMLFQNRIELDMFLIIIILILGFQGLFIIIGGGEE